MNAERGERLKRFRDPGVGQRRRAAGFTLLEVMISLFIFSIVLIAIYSTWILILKGTAAAQKAAAAVQRSRMAIRTIEDALLTVQMFSGNVTNYYFLADTSGDFAALELSARLPESFPGVGRYGDQVVRRVRFFTEAGKNGGTDLMMSQKPLLMELKDPADAYTIVLARDVTLFKLEFYDDRKDEWLDEWKNTNDLPKLVQVVLGQGKARNSFDPQDVVTRIIGIPSVAVRADTQGGPGAGMMPGVVPPGGPGAPGVPTVPGAPGVVQPGVIQPGYQPGYQPGIRPGFPNNPIRRR